MANFLQKVIYFSDIPIPQSLLSYSNILNLLKNLDALMRWIMFGYLPEAIKQEVIYYLQNDNFPAAKQIYDSWLSDHGLDREMNQ